MIPSPRGRHELDLDPHVLCKFGRDVDLEADQLAFLVSHRPGNERRHSDLECIALLDRLENALRGNLLLGTLGQHRGGDSESQGSRQY